MWITLAVAACLCVATLVRTRRRANKLRSKFTASEWSSTLSLRICTYISAYMDHHVDDPGFAILRIYGKSLLFLALMQVNYQKGLIAMMVLLVVLESSLDVIRVILAYRNCSQASAVVVVAVEDGEALEAEDDTTDSTRGVNNTTTTTNTKSRAMETESTSQPQQLEPTNVYEDLTRPQSIAILVFLTQIMLVSMVMMDTYMTSTRSCFNGKEGCIMLTSLGSYILYITGVFMMCVFYVGPGNQYGKKELNPTYWLKLFLLTRGSTRGKTVAFSWTHPSGAVKTITVSRDEFRLWTRFCMSYLVNSVGFLFLLHVLPVQVANSNSIMGVVFKAVGMLYLVDLDDTAGNVMTVVNATTSSTPSSSSHGTPGAGGTNGSYYGSNSNNGGGASGDNDSLQVANGNDDDDPDSTQFEAEKQQIIQQAMSDVEVKLQALARRRRTNNSNNNEDSASSSSPFLTMFNRQKESSNGTYHYSRNRTHGNNNHARHEKTPLV
jgi:hypothetical protein